VAVEGSTDRAPRILLVEVACPVLVDKRPQMEDEVGGNPVRVSGRSHGDPAAIHVV
jgi:hypothetical protein